MPAVVKKNSADRAHFPIEFHEKCLEIRGMRPVPPEGLDEGIGLKLCSELGLARSGKVADLRG